MGFHAEFLFKSPKAAVPGGEYMAVQAGKKQALAARAKRLPAQPYTEPKGRGTNARICTYVESPK